MEENIIKKRIKMYRMPRARFYYIIFLQTLFVFACILPPYALCWDMYVIPKWYAASSIAMLGILTLLLCPRMRERKLWKNGIRFAAALGILSQFIAVSVEISHNITSVMEIGVRGTFDNPCGLAVSLCLLLPLAMYGTGTTICGKTSIDRLGCTKVLLVLLISCMVCATHSRIGIFTILGYSLVWIWHYSRVRLIKCAFASVVLMLSFFMAFYTKVPSTNGRAFIVARSMELIMRKPITGYGSNGFNREYMSMQARYFKRHPNSKYGKLADNMRHPLNEYILLWVDYGITAPVLLLLMILLPVAYFRHHVIVNMLGMCLLIFSMFSYPFNYPLPVFVYLSLLSAFVICTIKTGQIIVFSICVTVALFFAIWLPGLFFIDNTISSAIFYSLHGKHNKAMDKYEKLYSFYRCSPVRILYKNRYVYTLYNYSRELFTTGCFSKAKATIIELEDNVVDYDTRLLTGDISYEIGEYSKAIDAYKTAAVMCPIRLAPLAGILNCYIKTERYSDAYRIAAKIVTMPVKIKNYKSERITEKARRYQREYENQKNR